MKASKVAAVVSALLATDAKPSEASILAAILAADKKGNDENEGLGPKEIEKKAGDKAKDEFPPKEKAEDEDKDDKPAKDADPDMDAEDEDDKDEMKGKDSDIQPKKSAGGNSGAGGAEPAKDKKGMDTATAVKVALDARDALHAARRDVETVLGVVAYDSAEDVYKAALTKLGVDTKGVHASAFRSLFQMARDKASASAPTLASDAATVKTMGTLIKGYNRLS